jgi:hypothetical protein
VFRRNETKTRNELLRAELGETWDHALRAAGHAAGGMRAAVGPKVGPAADRFRGAAYSGWGTTKAALAPVSEAAQQKVQRVKRGRKPARKRWPAVAGLVAGGAAVGAAAAFVLRRRRQQQLWEDYHHADPMAAGSHREGTGSLGAGTRARSAPGSGPAPAGHSQQSGEPAGTSRSAGTGTGSKNSRA